MLTFLFKKKMRLLSNFQFQLVYKDNIKLITSKFVCLSRLNQLFFPRLGISISKKNIRKSHDRNRIKRLIRESFRLQQKEMMFMDIIVIVKKNVNLLSNKIIIHAINRLWSYKN